MDGDGHRDIWNSVPDALATAANLLRKNGWQGGKTSKVGEVPLPGRQGSSQRLGCRAMKWQSTGDVNGKPLKSGSDSAELKAPDAAAAAWPS